jgi:outer membrane protein TolC
MKKKIIFSLILLFAFFSQSLFSQEEDTLIYRYRRMAVEYQQQIKMAQRSLEGAESKLKAARSGYGPRLDFAGNYSYYGVPLQLAPPADAPIGTPGDELHNMYSLDLTLTQPILTGGYLKNTKRAAESEVEAMQSYVKLSEQQVMLNSDATYINTVAKKEIYNLALAYRDIVGQFVNVINDRVEEEVVGKNQLYQANVRFNDAQYQVLRSSKQFEVSLMKLNKLMGFPIDSVPQIADSLSAIKKVISPDSMITKALTNRPDLAYLKGKVTASQYREKVTISKYNPQMGVLAGGKWGAPSPGLNINPDFNYYFKANLKIPIFYWGQKRKEAFAVKQVTEIAKLQVDQTKDAVILDVQRSYFNLKKSQEQMEFAHGSLNNAKQNVSLMLDRYNEGLSSVLEVLDAQAFWQKSYFNYIQAKYDVNLAYSEYLHALGELTKEYNK